MRGGAGGAARTRRVRRLVSAPRQLTPVMRLSSPSSSTIISQLNVRLKKSQMMPKYRKSLYCAAAAAAKGAPRVASATARSIYIAWECLEKAPRTWVWLLGTGIMAVKKRTCGRRATTANGTLPGARASQAALWQAAPDCSHLDLRCDELDGHHAEVGRQEERGDPERPHEAVHLCGSRAVHISGVSAGPRQAPQLMHPLVASAREGGLTASVVWRNCSTMALTKSVAPTNRQSAQATGAPGLCTRVGAWPLAVHRCTVGHPQLNAALLPNRRGRRTPSQSPPPVIVRRRGGRTPAPCTQEATSCMMLVVRVAAMQRHSPQDDRGAVAGSCVMALLPPPRSRRHKALLTESSIICAASAACCGHHAGRLRWPRCTSLAVADRSQRHWARKGGGRGVKAWMAFF